MSKAVIATNIKHKVEEVVCQNCNQSTLMFDSINFNYNGSVVVKAVCPSCESSPYIIIENVPRAWESK